MTPSRSAPPGPQHSDSTFTDQLVKEKQKAPETKCPTVTAGSASVSVSLTHHVHRGTNLHVCCSCALQLSVRPSAQSLTVTVLCAAPRSRTSLPALSRWGKWVYWLYCWREGKKEMVPLYICVSSTSLSLFLSLSLCIQHHDSLNW